MTEELLKKLKSAATRENMEKILKNDRIPLSDEMAETISGGAETLISNLDTQKLADKVDSVLASQSARFKTGDTRGPLTDEELEPDYIHRQIFGSKLK